jgi:autotransporter-associated beta strand protein
MKDRLNIFQIACGVGLFFSLSFASVFAQTWQWDGSSSGWWNTAANWTPASIPSALDATVTIGSIVTGQTTIGLRGTRTVGTLNFQGSQNFTISSGSGATRNLWFDVSSGTAAINISDSTISQIDSTVRLALYDNTIISHTGTGLFTISGVISESGGARSLTHTSSTGTGTTLLSGANTFGGGLAVNSGTVQFGSNTAAGTGTLTLSGGAIEAFGAARALSNAVTVAGDFTVGGAQALTLSGAMNLGLSQRTVTTSNTALTTFSGVVSGTGGITKEGPGRLAFTGTTANTYTGPTTVNAGTLELAKSSGVASIAGSAITVNSGGTLLLGSSNQIIDSANLTLAGGTLSTGDTVGFSETLGTLTLSGTSSIDLGTAAHMLNFANSSALSGAWSGTLTIYGWTGLPQTSGTSGQIYFGSNVSGLTPSQLAMISFSGFGGGSILLTSGELVPTAIPEAGTVVAAALLALLAAWRERRRLPVLLPRMAH